MNIQIINVSTENYHNQLKNHRHICIIQSFSNYQLKILLKHQQNIMELFCFEFIDFNTVNKQILCHYNANLSEISSSDPSIGALPKVRIYFFLLSTCVDKLISAPYIITFFYQTHYHHITKNFCAHQIQHDIQNIDIYQNDHFFFNSKAPSKPKISTLFKWPQIIYLIHNINVYYSFIIKC